MIRVLVQHILGWGKSLGHFEFGDYYGFLKAINHYSFGVLGFL